MPTFLDDLSTYNAKASLAISNAVTNGHSEKANLMSSLKTVANDTTLLDDVRLKALTTLINVGNLLDAPLPPYFPITQTYATGLTYQGIHNDLSGLNEGDYLHLSAAEKADVLNKASLGDINFSNLQGVYSDNLSLYSAFNAKQNALSGTGFVKIVGTTISYDNNVYISDINNIAAGGELQGYYPNPTLNNLSVIGKVLTGFVGTAMPLTPITNADSILSAIQKLNNNISNIVANPGGVTSIALTNNAGTVFNTTTTPQTGPATINVSLNTQNKNLFLASSATVNGHVPSFRAITVDDLPATGNPATTIGGSTVIPVVQIDSKGRVVSLTSAAAATGGIVNTVNMTVPSNSPTIFTSTGGGSSSTVNVGFGLATQVKNTFFAGPTTGANATPQFRALQMADIGFDIPWERIDGLKDQLNLKLGISLGSSLIYMGNGSAQAVETKVGGDLDVIFSQIQNTNTAVFTVNPGTITYSKFQNIPASAGNTIRPILLGRFHAGQGEMQELTLSSDFTLNAITGQIGLLTPNPPALNDVGDLLTSTGANNLTRLSLPQPNNDGYLLMPYAAATTPACGLIWGQVLGDITYTVDNTTTPGTPFGLFSIGANKVTFDKIQQIADQTFIGNNNGVLDDAQAITAADATQMLSFFSSTSLDRGLVVGSNNLGSSYYLDATGAWTQPPGGGGTPGGSSWQFQYNDNGTGFAGSANLAATNAGDVLATSGYFGIVDDATTPTVGVYISAPDVTVAGLDWSIPATNANDIFVGEAFAQTLTNKTLGASTVIAIPGGGTDVGTLWYSSDASGTVAELHAAGNIGMFLRQSSTGAPEWAIPTDIAGGTANQVLYQSSPGDTSFIAAPTTANTFLKWTGSAFSWDVAGSGTINNANQFSVTYYSAAGSANTLDGLAPQITNGTYFLSQAIAGGAAAAPAWTGVTGTGVVVLQDTPTLMQPRIGNGSGNGHMHFRRGNTPGGLASNATLAFLSASKTMSLEFDTDNYQSQLLFGATSTQTYTFPNSTGTVALIDNTQLLFIPPSGGNSGKIALGGSTLGTITLQAPASVSGSGSYILPSSYPAAANQYLTSTTGGAMSWVSITGGGDVSSNITSSTAGTFAVFADALGKTITQPSVATLSPTGRATFNDGVDVGVSGPSGGTTGTLVFRSSVNSGRTIIQAAATPSASDIFYFLPSAQATGAGQILANDGSGNLSWTVAGAGNMILASTQINTGAKTFNSGTLILAGSSGGNTTLNASATASGTVTLPALTGTVALLENSQTFTGPKIFQAQVNIGNGVYTTSSLVFGGTTSNFINFGQNGAGSPTLVGAGGTTRSVGTKVILLQNVGAFLDAALGVSGDATNGNVWVSSANDIRFFASNSTAVTGYFAHGSTNRGLILDAISNGTNTAAQLQIGGVTSAAQIQYITWPVSLYNPAGNPVRSTTRSAGAKIVLSQNLSTSTLDCALGIAGDYTGGVLWLTSAGPVRFYTDNSDTIRASFDGNSAESRLTLTNATAVSIIASTATTANVFNTVATTVNIAGASTTLTIGATTGTTTIRNATLALPNATQITIQGNKVVGTRVAGYGTPTNGNRTLSFAAVTQAEQVLAQLVADLKSHGLIA